jgi:hypothetical protein
MRNKTTLTFSISQYRQPLLKIRFIHYLLSYVAIMACCMQTAYCQPPAIEWDRSFGGLKQEEMYAMIQTSDGGYLLGGDSDSPISGAKTQGSQGINDYWVVRTNASGNKVWDKRFGGNSREELFAVKETPDGGFILGGWSMSVISGDQTQSSRGSSDYWIVKVDANGNKLWDKRYGGPGDDELRAMEITSDGGYIFVGESSSGIGGEKTESNHGEFDVWAVKTDVNGNLQWEATYGGSLDDRVNAIQQTPDGGFIIGAWTISPVGFDVTQTGRGSSDMWLIKTDANGLKLWDGRYGGNDNEYLYSLGQTQDGGFILGGYTRSNVNGEVTIPGKGGFDFWIVKTDIDGVKLWDKRYGGQQDEKGKSIAVTADGGFVMGGWSESLSGGDKTESTKGASDYWVIKMDAEGNLQWDKDLGAANEERLHDVLQTSDGGFIIAGHSFSGINGDKTQSNTGINDYWIVKLAATTPTQLFYADNDNDGFGNVLMDTMAVSAPAGYVEMNTDCNDNNAAINPAASEICNAGIDDNCNGLSDDGDITVTGQFSYYSDNDLDTYGTGVAILSCIQPGGSSLNAGDCNDNNTAINPAANEICNAGIDDNCNGLADDGDLTTIGQSSYYTDNDNDNFGSNLPIYACIQPANTLLVSGDCNDNESTIHPLAKELCNGGIDDNCNGVADDADTTVIGRPSYYTDNDHDNYGSGAAIKACIQPEGTSSENDDCNNNNAAVYPGAPEICNGGIDDNCNGLSDDGDPTLIGLNSYYADSDHDSYGTGDALLACIQPAATATIGGDCNDSNATINPAATETCNAGIDDNCNGLADDADGTITGQGTYYPDNDEDGYGGETIIAACLQPAGSTLNAGDCNDVNAAVNPGATDLCNGIDDNCNLVTDENQLAVPVINPEGEISACSGDAVLLSAAFDPSLSYQWYKGNSLINGATSNTYSTTKAGSFKVKISTMPGCEATSAFTMISRFDKPNAQINALGNLDICTTGAVDLLANEGTGLQYQWKKGNSLLDGATNMLYTATTKGTYRVIVTNADGCSKTSGGTKVTSSCKSELLLAKEVSSELVIYPNPADRFIMVELSVFDESSGSAVIELTDLLGRVVQSVKVPFSGNLLQYQLPLDAAIADGNYVLHVTTGNKVFVKQVVVQQ